MKTIILASLLIFSQFTFAKELICKQKIVPVKTDYTSKADKINVVYTAEQDISQFSISEIRGLDGLKIISKSNLVPKDLSKGESIAIEVTIKAPEGQSFLVTDIQGVLDSQHKFQSLVIPIGELSDSQKRERSKNIKSLPSVNKMKSGANALETETKYHTMKLPE